jgi:hypothetical protein
MHVTGARDRSAISAQATEQVCKALADAVTGSQIPGLIAPLKVTERPGDEHGSKWTRLYNAVAARQNAQRDGRPLIRLVAEVMAPVRFASQADFDSTRARINQRLLLSGFEVRESGKVGRVTPAATIGEAQQRADDLHADWPAATSTRTSFYSAAPSLCSRTTSTLSWRPPRASPTSCAR